tara:strand:+ start:965 stop:1570 length:606 start_codon:yes stop_codon:yes gene_type:complete
MTPPLGSFKAAVFGAAGVSLSDVVLISKTPMTGEAYYRATFDSAYVSAIFAFSGLVYDANDTDLKFQVSTSGDSYGVSTANVAWRTLNSTGGSDSSAFPKTSMSQAAATDYMELSENLTDDATIDGANTNGFIQIYNPKSTTFGKNFMSVQIGNVASGDSWGQWGCSGYIDTASALDKIEFKLDDPAANMDAGTISYWGVK